MRHNLFIHSGWNTSSSVSSRLMHDSLCSIFSIRAQSVKKLILWGCHENSNTQTCVHLCRSYPCPGFLASGVDRCDCFSPFFHFLCEFWINLVFFHVTSQSVLASWVRPWRFLPSHIHCCYFLSYIILIFSHHMGMPGNAALCDMCGDWFDHCSSPEYFVSDSVIPDFALNPS